MTPDDISPRARALLEAQCDFSVGAEPSALSMLPSTPDCTLVAGHGGGGCFYAWGDGPLAERPVVFLSSDGEASRFAANLREALAIVVTCPYGWIDALYAAHHGDDRLARALAAAASERTDAQRAACERLRAELGLDEIDVAAALRAAVRATPRFAPTLTTEGGPTPAGSF